MTKPIQSSTGGDALRERIEKMPTYPYDTWEGKVLVSRSDVLALLAPPLIKQEALREALEKLCEHWEEPGGEESPARGYANEFAAEVREVIRRLAPPPVGMETICVICGHRAGEHWLRAGGIQECGEQDCPCRKFAAIKQEAETPDTFYDHKLHCGHRSTDQWGDEGGTPHCGICEPQTSKQEVVAPVGEETKAREAIMQAAESVITVQRNLIDHLRKAPWDGCACSDCEERIEEQRFMRNEVSCKASSVSGPSEGLKLENITFIAQCYEDQINAIQEILIDSGMEPEDENSPETIVEAVKFLAKRAAQSAAGTSKQEDFSEPAKEDL